MNALKNLLDFQRKLQLEDLKMCACSYPPLWLSFGAKLFPFKFTHERSRDSINFLDVNVKIRNNRFTTDLFCNETDCHQYLHFDSCHPSHMKQSSVYSQGLRLRRLCSEDTTFQTRLQELACWFEKRGYPKRLIDSQITKCFSVPREDSLKVKEREKTEVGIPFVVKAFFKWSARLDAYFTCLYIYIYRKSLKVSI